jgi:cyclomaltodextrinase / maltogenic alpha-amylase / neopullulanase
MKFIKHYAILTLFVATLGCTLGTQRDPQTDNQSNITHPEWSYNKVIYEINIRQYSTEGSFRAVQQDLPRLKELGVGILWLMPIHPIGVINRKGTLGSYYSVQDYFDVNPEFGDKEDFRAFVEAAHQQGFYVILDWVANHTAWDNPIADTHPEFFEKDENGQFIPPRGTDWDDVIQLDYTNSALREYMISAMEYWVKEFDIDGYRCDVADMVPVDFWDAAKQRLEQIKPVFMLAEAENPEHHVNAFNMSYSWEMHHTFNRIAKGDASATAIDSLIKRDQLLFPSNAFRMNFTSNHDENSWNGTVFERLGDAVEVFAVISATIPGMPLIYNGQEAGLNKRLEFFEADPIEWTPNPLFDIYQSLNELKSTNPALANGERGGNYARIPTDNEALFAYTRSLDSNRVIVVANLSPESVNTVIDVTGISGSYTSLTSQQKVILTAEMDVKLGPWEYFVYVK